MTDSERKKIIQRLLARVSTGLSFVEFEYLARHKNPDAAWIRNIYILLSFYTELLLKAIFIVKNHFKNLTELDEKLKKLGHNLEMIGSEIKKGEPSYFGIKSIHLKNHEYCVATDEGSFYVKDFNDIRYDFLDGMVRTLNGDEHDMLKKQIEIMFKIIKKLKPLAW